MSQKSKFLIDSIEFHSSHSLQTKFPDHESMPHIAFSGRSNAGKSSLINAVVERKDLVKVSSTPGKTRTLNFFLLNSRIFLVDLPGFGYAKASNTIRDTMIELVNHYLNSVQNLKVLFILVDASRPMPTEEVEIAKTCIVKSIQPVIVRTKTDKLNTKEKDKLKKEMKNIQAELPEVLVIYSAIKNKQSILEIRNIIKTV
jgi:GTP-binding protein